MAYEKNTWIDNETPITAEKLNKMEQGIEDAGKTGGVEVGTIVHIEDDAPIPEGYVEVEETPVKTETIWSGNAYEINTKVTLNEPMKKGQLYIFTFYGLSSTYLMQFPFTFVSTSFQIAYYDGSSYFRYRLDIYTDGTALVINNNSTNTASNNALIKIEKVVM